MSPFVLLLRGILSTVCFGVSGKKMGLVSFCHSLTRRGPIEAEQLTADDLAVPIFQMSTGWLILTTSATVKGPWAPGPRSLTVQRLLGQDEYERRTGHGMVDSDA